MLQLKLKTLFQTKVTKSSIFLKDSVLWIEIWIRPTWVFNLFFTHIGLMVCVKMFNYLNHNIKNYCSSVIIEVLNVYVCFKRWNKWVFDGFNFAMLLPDNSFSWLLTAAEKVTSNSLMWFRHNYGNKITRPKKANQWPEAILGWRAVGKRHH